MSAVAATPGRLERPGSVRSPARMARIATIAGVLGLLGSIAFAAFLLRGAGAADDDVFGPISDLVGACACVATIPVVLALRDVRRGPIAEAGVVASAAWLLLTCVRLRDGERLPRPLTRLGILLAGTELAAAAGLIATLVVASGARRHAALVAFAIPGGIAWALGPVWLLALARALDDPPTRAQGAAAGPTAPIELAPRAGSGRRLLRRLRRLAAWLHAALALVIVAAVFLQVYLIGAYVFGAGERALDLHRTVGFATHGLECVVLLATLAGRLPRTDVLLSLLLAVIGTAQVILAGGHGWVGALHPLGALVVLAIAALLVARGPLRHRAAGRGAPVP